MIIKGEQMLVFEERQVESRESMIRECYEEVFPIAATYIQKQGGSMADAREVFQESLVTYYEKLVDSSFEPDLNINAYLMGIVKNKWLRYRVKMGRSEDLADKDCIQEQEQVLRRQKLIQFLKLSGKRCMDLLQSFYYEKISMKQLAARFGYASERSATVQKYKCLEKVREEVKQKSWQYEDFFE